MIVSFLLLFYSDPENVDQNMEVEQEVENENISAEERQIIDRYNLNDYDDEDDTALNHSELVVFADNNQDPYLNNEDEFSDVRKSILKGGHRAVFDPFF